jgi:hypothetical protein
MNVRKIVRGKMTPCTSLLGNINIFIDIRELSLVTELPIALVILVELGNNVRDSLNLEIHHEILYLCILPIPRKAGT